MLRLLLLTHSINIQSIQVNVSIESQFNRITKSHMQIFCENIRISNILKTFQPEPMTSVKFNKEKKRKRRKVH